MPTYEERSPIWMNDQYDLQEGAEPEIILII